jgi:sec-independent protein translocase protein TatC
MTLGIAYHNFHGFHLPVLYYDPLNNISAHVIAMMKESLFPENVSLIQTSPGQVFFAQIQVSLMMGIILSIPLIVKEILGFVSPGLYQAEKGLIGRLIILTTGLFVIGALFSYFVVVPIILDFLYKYGQLVGASTFFDISEFIPFVLQIIIASGVSFEFPLIMSFMTRLEIVSVSFWRNKLRYVIIILAIVGAIITPDASGITMWLVTGPMIGLYILTMLIMERKSRTRII